MGGFLYGVRIGDMTLGSTVSYIFRLEALGKKE